MANPITPGPVVSGSEFGVISTWLLRPCFQVCGTECFSVIGVSPALRHASDSVWKEPVPDIHHSEIEWSAIYLNQVSIGVHQEYLRESCQPRSLQYQFLGMIFRMVFIVP